MTNSGTREQLLESIRLENGLFPLLEYHQERIDRSRKLLFPKANGLKLDKLLQGQQFPTRGLYKVRILYGESVSSIEFIPYQIKRVRSLKVVVADDLRYPKKYANRFGINKHLAERGHHDDILMSQHGFLTDTSYANVALFDGTSWYTPASPLLRGTRRACLLRKGIIKTAVIRVKDLPHFKQLRLMNSMLPWHEAPTIPIENIER